ncbi:hypothetical protein BD410DRAFT_720172, partial [Rickenella mellea]
VGAGPSGLVAALSLLKNGVRVRIVDKEPNYRVGSRGAGMMPRTLEVMNMLGVLPDIERHCARIPPLQSYKPPHGVQPSQTWELMENLEPLPSRPFRRPVEIPQDVQENILRSHLRQFGCEVELGTELLNFVQDESSVTVQLLKHAENPLKPEVARFRFVIGADGAKGMVRKKLGLKFMGDTRDADELVVGDVEITGLNSDFWHFWSDPSSNSKTTISLRPSGSTRNYFSMLTVGHDLQKYDLTDPRNFRIFFHKISGRRDIILGHFRWLSYFKPNMRMANNFQEGHVFIVGDAAHVHSPTGGQGMNSGVQDSFNLAWKLSLVVKGYASENLLSSYSEERLPVISEMLQRVTSIHGKTFAGGELHGGESRGWTRGKALHMLGINYRWSRIVVDERTPRGVNGDELRCHAYGGHDNSLSAGDRAPEAPGLVIPTERRETSLFKVLKATHHTVLIFPCGQYSRAEGILRLLSSWPHFLVQTICVSGPGAHRYKLTADLNLLDRDGHAHSAYFVDQQPTIFIIRPDGVIGGIVRDEGGVARYFSRIFQNALFSEV